MGWGGFKIKLRDVIKVKLVVDHVVEYSPLIFLYTTTTTFQKTEQKPKHLNKYAACKHKQPSIHGLPYNNRDKCSGGK